MEKGVALVEYVFIMALVVMLVIGVLTLFGTELRDFYQNIIDQIQGLL